MLSSLAKLRYIQYTAEKEAIYLSAIRQLMSKDLSEPYSIYVYRYFLGQWGDLCYMVSTSLFLPLVPLVETLCGHWMKTTSSSGSLFANWNHIAEGP